MPPSSPSSRRRFLSQATFAGGAFFISSRLTSCGGKANGAINVAVVGLKGRGGDHLATYKKNSRSAHCRDLRCEFQVPRR